MDTVYVTSAPYDIGAMGGFLAGFAMTTIFVFFAIGILFYILQAVGLQAMAKNRGMDNGWLGWIPIANTWLLGQLSGPNVLFGKWEFKNLFAFVFIGSFLTNILVCFDSALMVLLALIAAIVLMYALFVMYRDFFAYYTDNPVAITILSFLFTPLLPIMIFVYRNREVRERGENDAFVRKIEKE